MSAGQLRLIKSRIRSVENTKKITRAMEMVSAAKLRRFQTLMHEAQPFTQGLEETLMRLVNDQKGAQQSSYSHPFFEARDEKRSAVIVITSDTGLCGSYNMDLIETAKNHLASLDHEPVLIGVGKSGVHALKRTGRSFEKTFIGTRPAEIEDVIQSLKQTLENLYLEQKIDSAHVIFSHFISAALCKSVVQKILPFEQIEGPQDGAVQQSSYIYEPDPAFIFNKLIPLYFEAKIRMLLLESYVSEHMARMNAMHQATKNAKEMIDSLVLVRNKVRQAIITKEIIEIISGSQALKK